MNMPVKEFKKKLKDYMADNRDMK